MIENKVFCDVHIFDKQHHFFVWDVYLERQLQQYKKTVTNKEIKATVLLSFSSTFFVAIAIYF